MPSELSAGVRSLLRRALGSVHTAAVCLIYRHGAGVCEEAMGNSDPEGGGGLITARTPFDLASITKLFTGAAALRLVAAGHLDLDAPVHLYLPGFLGGAKAQVQIRHLLTHTSGLPPGPGLHGPGAPVDPWGALLAIPLCGRPGGNVVYSDTGFMVLGRAIEAVYGGGLDTAISALVCEPLGIGAAGFGPRPEAAATEWDGAAGRRLCGEVHDENARAVGGIAGHAGLFGTADDVLRLARAFAQPECGFLPRDLAETAVSEQAVDGGERRGLAWKLRSPLPDAPDHVFAPSTFGHYGFTGTAVWHDPARDTTVVLLTNRVYYGRDPEPNKRLRADLFALIAQSTTPPAKDEAVAAGQRRPRRRP